MYISNPPKRVKYKELITFLGGLFFNYGSFIIVIWKIYQ